MQIKKPSTASKDLAPPEQHFPSARYFQIHFQYLQEIIGDLRLQMEKANQQITELHLQLQLNQAVQDSRQDDSGNKPDMTLR